MISSAHMHMEKVNIDLQLIACVETNCRYTAHLQTSLFPARTPIMDVLYKKILRKQRVEGLLENNIILADKTTGKWKNYLRKPPCI